MRKLLKNLCVVIFLCAAGGLAFFFGWVQSTVPPGTFGIMRSKTHGLDPHLIQEGEFRWAWYKLIPTNVTIQTFDLQTINRRINVKGMLPAASDYAAFANLQTDFSFDISADFSFAVDPAALITIVEDNNLKTQEEFNRYQNALADKIEIFLRNRIRQALNADDNRNEFLNSARTIESLKNTVDTLPELREITVSFTQNQIPDMLLYQKIREQYGEHVTVQQDIEQTTVELLHIERDLAQIKKNLAELAMESRQDEMISLWIRIEELTQYGELLTQYPVLLDYLRLEKE
ncbi:hypothetical protein FACS1894172_10190 [Spirochaetia bacterium]|nr:hypothetical protein FACS1894164_10210 [Spirochaetia bacterium]GHU32839.1 hypothetical protein FACS1894172_10190 [Spirochaetia bacterium]